MCNACGMVCCAGDEFEHCGCLHCAEPACWPPACPICGEPGCTTCEDEVYGQGDDGWDDEHDPDCPCDVCTEIAIETAIKIDMGELP